MEAFLDWEIFNRWSFEFITSFWGESGFSRLCGIIGVFGIWWVFPAIVFFFWFRTDSPEVEKVYFSDGSDGLRPTGKVIKGDPETADGLATFWILFYPVGFVYILLMQEVTLAITGNQDIDAVIKWGVIPLLLIILIVLGYAKLVKPKSQLEEGLLLIFVSLMALPVLVWIITALGSLVKYLIG